MTRIFEQLNQGLPEGLRDEERACLLDPARAVEALEMIDHWEAIKCLDRVIAEDARTFVAPYGHVYRLGPDGDLESLALGDEFTDEANWGEIDFGRGPSEQEACVLRRFQVRLLKNRVTLAEGRMTEAQELLTQRNTRVVDLEHLADGIVKLLDGQFWSPTTLNEIADLLRSFGFHIGEPECEDCGCDPCTCQEQAESAMLEDATTG